MADAPRQTKLALSLEKRSGDVKEFSRYFSLPLNQLYTTTYRPFPAPIPETHNFFENAAIELISY
jgi:hypothetical protein